MPHGTTFTILSVDTGAPLSAFCLSLPYVYLYIYISSIHLVLITNLLIKFIIKHLATLPYRTINP